MGFIPMAVMVPMNNNLVSSWTTIWNALSNFSFLTKALAFLGACLVVWALIKMIAAKVRNRPMDTKMLVWAIVIGAFLLFPNDIIKAILGIADSAITAVRSLLTSLFS